MSHLKLPFISEISTNMHKTQPDTQLHAFQCLIDAFDLFQHVPVPTHIKGNTLNLLISPSDLKDCVRIPVSDYCISDHSLALAGIAIKTAKDLPRYQHNF